MVTYGCFQCQADHTLFVKQWGSKVTTLIVYVDDIVVIGNDEAKMRELKCYLAKEFEIVDLGQLKYFFVIEVAYSKMGIFIS